MSTDICVSDNSEDGPRFHLCESSTIFARIAVAVSSVVLVLHIVAMASPYWTAADMRGVGAFHAGIWIECTKANIFTTNSQWSCHTYSADHHLSTLPAFLKATQGMAILGLIFMVLELFLVCLYVILPRLAGRKIASFLALGLALSAGVLTMIGAIVYAADYPTPEDVLGLHTWRFGYAFAFEFLVGILCLGVSGLIVDDMRKSLLINSLRFF